MEGFVTKRRKTDPTASTNAVREDDSTELKLAILASLHPEIKTENLLDILTAAEGSVEKALSIIQPPNEKLKRIPNADVQTSLQFGEQSAGPASKPLTRKGKTLHLYSPEDIAAHTPCSIIHNFLDPELANSLLSELLLESATFSRASFKLFDNVVQSPHSIGFYVSSLDDIQQQKTDYVYNGSYLTDVRQLTPLMEEVSDVVKDAVNAEIKTRIRTHYPGGKKLKYQPSKEWKPNAAFVNRYAGAKESVGYHSDQLTYLGPRAVIGSLSLGVAREFRVRKIVPKDDPDVDANSVADASGQISIHLPHNSLLVMHAEMQEEWKHSISPAPNITPHPIAGNDRINITYRWYRESLHPKYTPKCRCGIPCILRCVQRKKDNHGRYMWMCYAGNRAEAVKGKDGCKFFQWAKFDDDGEPIWEHGQGTIVAGQNSNGNE